MQELSKTRWSSLIRALTYRIIVCPDPLDPERIEEALVTVRRFALSAPREEYLRAVEHALASRDDLSELVDLPHSDALVREFLRRVRARLERRS